MVSDKELKLKKAEGAFMNPNLTVGLWGGREGVLGVHDKRIISVL